MCQRLEQAHKVSVFQTAFVLQLESIFNPRAKVRITDKEVKNLFSLPWHQTRKFCKTRLKRKTKCPSRFSNLCDAVCEYNQLSHTTNRNQQKRICWRLQCRYRPLSTSKAIRRWSVLASIWSARLKNTESLLPGVTDFAGQRADVLFLN